MLRLFRHSIKYRRLSGVSINKAKELIISIGHSTDIADDVISVLKESGISHNNILSTVSSLAGRWEVGEDSGLEDIIISIKQQNNKKLKTPLITFRVVPPGKKNKKYGFDVTSNIGMSITDVVKYGVGDGAKQLKEYIECSCSGIMACSTCHIIIDKKWFSEKYLPDEDEQDMLDLAYGYTPTSRLGCQFVLSEKHNGLIIHIPSGVNNIMDNIPF